MSNRRCFRSQRASGLQALRRLSQAGFVLVVALAVATLVQQPSLFQGAAEAAAGCQLVQIAFCDTFDAPSALGAGTRSGDLDGVVWGVSHATSDDNPSQGSEYNWNASHLNRCGSVVLVAPPRDVQICNGTLVESVSDGGAVAALAMYPRQPFDFAGRTGKIVFDVTNDTQGSHMAWPEIVITDQPVPAPFESASGLADFARNSFGVDLGADCLNGALVPNGQGDSWAVSEMWSTSNYRFNLQTFAMHGCVKKSTGVGGAMNHVELRVSPTHVEIWATDPGSTNLVQLASADLAMPLTRGLVWMEDAHYNACKEPGTQCDHTFQWDNFGFDGPILPRDLAFDAPDHEQNFTSSGSIGYLVPAGGSLSLQIPNVHGVSQASAALLEFTWYPRQFSSVSYNLNGHGWHTQAWPYANVDAPTYKSQTIAIPVSLAEIVAGTNVLQLSSSETSLGGLSTANFDLILVGAGGLSAGSPPAPAATATPTATAPVPAPAVATATPTPTATAVAPSTTTSTVLVGAATVAPNLDTNGPGEAQAFPFIATATGTGTKIGVYLDASSTASVVQIGIYSNTSTNQPGNLLAVGNFTAPVHGWNSVTVQGFNVTAGRQYWIAILAPFGSGGAMQYRDQSSGALSVVSQSTSLSYLPMTWTSGSTWPSGKISAYLSS